MHVPDYYHAGYTGSIIKTSVLREKIRQAMKILRPMADQFEGIAFRGASGMFPGPILALRLRKSIILVRKGEETHSTYPVEGDRAVKSYIIVDDQIATGSTIEAIMHGVRSFAAIGNKPRLLGVLLTGSGEDSKVHFRTPDYREVSDAIEKVYGQMPEGWIDEVKANSF